MNKMAFCNDVLIIAVEGGIGWATVIRYTTSPAASAVVVELEDPEARHSITRRVVARGIARVILSPVNGLSEDYRAALVGACVTKNAEMIDAVDGDILVQVGLFGEVIYG